MLFLYTHHAKKNVIQSMQKCPKYYWSGGLTDILLTRTNHYWHKYVAYENQQEIYIITTILPLYIIYTLYCSGNVKNTRGYHHEEYVAERQYMCIFLHCI